METVTLNCPTFCELLPCSAGLVLGLDSAFLGCGHVARPVVKMEGPCRRPGSPRRVLGFILAPSSLPGVLQRMLGPKPPYVHVDWGASKKPTAPLHRVPQCLCGVLGGSPESALPQTSLVSEDGVPAVVWGGRESGFFFLFVSMIKTGMSPSPTDICPKWSF